MSRVYPDFTPPVIAHRGARNRAPENTMAAFVAAREDGVRWIETNVKLTSDGMPILFHDDTLDRTTNGTGPVAEHTWADIQNLDTGSWFASSFAGTRITTLPEFLGFAHSADMRVNLELKPCPGRIQATAMVALIEAAKVWPENVPPPLISSFDIECLVIAAQLHPEWPRGLLLDEWRDDWGELVALTQATTLNLKADILTPEHLAMLRKAHIPVLAYTVNDPAHAQTLLSSGVRAIFTDNPDDILSLL